MHLRAASRLLFSALLFVLGCGTAERAGSRYQRYAPGELDRCISVRIERRTLGCPLNWWRIYFTYESLDTAVMFEVSRVFECAVTQESQVLRSPGVADSLRFGELQLAEFFKEFRPRYLGRSFHPRRSFNVHTFDTVQTNREGKVIHVPDISVFYSILLPDTACQSAIEKLMQIPGISSVRRRGQETASPAVESE